MVLSSFYCIFNLKNYVPKRFDNTFHSLNLKNKVFKNYLHSAPNLLLSNLRLL